MSNFVVSVAGETWNGHASNECRGRTIRKGGSVRSLAVLGVSLLMLWASACSRDPHKLKITDENKDKFLESIRDSKGLTVEENRLLMAYMMRSSMAQSERKTCRPWARPSDN
jgi:hypothetical protein